MKDKIGVAMASEERLAAILSGIEKIKQEKPYAETADAIAALDWISAATNDVNSALGESADDVTAMVRFQELSDSLGRLHSSITSAIKRSGNDVPRRHDDEPTVNS